MNHAVIHVESLSKQYRLRHSTERYRTARDVIARFLRRPWRAFGTGGGARTAPADDDTIWALRDVSFDIGSGEVVGIIGRNGAGKSTILKVLSRITEPTEGFADITGRIGALLEVGTGFHPELTGRENVYLSGAILGMRRQELSARFDEIVEFAEVRRFVDTPVKHYSSGMYLRLAFAVAAHLQPDVLLVDEVLAVGDAAFQAKCLGKMSEVASEGRTVLFVSHNMSAIASLCSRALVFDDGRVCFDGTPGEAIAAYTRTLQRTTDTRTPTSGACTITDAIRVNGTTTAVVQSGEGFTVSLALRARDLDNPWMFFIVEDAHGRTVIHSRVLAQDIGPSVLDGTVELRLEVPPLWLSAGGYTAHFKFLTSQSSGSSGRVSSSPVMLDVRGAPEHSGKAVLNPSIAWHVATGASVPEEALR